MTRNDKPSVRVIKEQIIEFYRDNPMLYEKTHPQYKATDLHDDILRNFATRLSLEVREVIQYWSNLKSNYQAKLREIKSSLISGTGLGDERVPNKKNKPEDWEYFQLLGFLNDSIDSQGRLSACNMPKIALKHLVLSPPKKGHATDGNRVCIISKDQLARLSTITTKTLMSTITTASSSSVTNSVKPEVVDDSVASSAASALPKTSNYKKRKLENGNIETVLGSVGELIKSQVAPMQQSAIELIDIDKQNSKVSHSMVEPESSACAVQMKGLAMQMEKLPQDVQDELL
ncbi:hypothetical protein B566_EDAN017621, partial [Ephemera danica]